MYRTLHELLRQHAQHQPDRAAIYTIDRPPLTYGELWQQVVYTARTLRGLGINRGDRVALVLPNGAELAVAFLAIAAGATTAPLNPGYRAPEFDFYLTDLHAKALILPHGIESPARDVAHQRGITVIELDSARGAKAGQFSLMVDAPDTENKVDFAGADDLMLILHTSGTTSRPKIVPLTQTSVLASARNVATTLQLVPADRCLNVMPLFHIHGLVVALLASMRSGGSVVCTPGFYAPHFFDWLYTHTPTWYTAAPTIHQAVLTRAVSRPDPAAANLRFVHSSSAALPPSVMQRLESTFRAPVIEAYGMTEAAYQITSNPLPPKPRKPGSVGLPAGPDVAIMDASGRLLPNGQAGEVVMRGENVTSGYENNPEANAHTLTNGWFRTGDQGFIDADGYLTLSGRIKEMINRAGEKVSPLEVDEILLQHPAVEQAVTFGVPHATLGEAVAAAIILKPGATADAISLQKFADEHLISYKVPEKIVFPDAIPKTATGKFQRVDMAERLGISFEEPVSSAPTTHYEAPRSPLEATITAIWSDVLQIKRIGIHDEFLRLGGDSILATQIVLKLKAVTEVKMSLVDFFNTPTVADMAEKITELQTTSP